MALTNVPLGPVVGKTIEFVGVGPIGQKRPIDSFDFVCLGPLQRVNVVAPPSKDWLVLFSAWAPATAKLHVSLSIRSGNTLVLLTLKEVIPLYFGLESVDAHSSKIPRVLASFGSQQVVVSRVQPVTVSVWDRYMPAAVQRGIPSGRFQ
jgi:hypothetical protein